MVGTTTWPWSPGDAAQSRDFSKGDIGYGLKSRAKHRVAITAISNYSGTGHSMTVLNSVHHINFIVADLERAVHAYQSVLGLGPFEYQELPERGVVTARVRVGGVWIVLVSPQSEDCVAGRYLEANGEGFFLMSFGVDDLDRAMADLAMRGAMPEDGRERTGILDWQVADLDTEDSLGVRFHLTLVR